MGPSVIAVSRDARHRFSKQTTDVIRLMTGFGVEGDSHAGATVQHRWGKRINPTQPNLRQVHILQAELCDELRVLGFEVKPGELGENITTRGVDLLALPTGTMLRFGAEATVELTGLRTPCRQVNKFSPGLLKHLAVKGPDGQVVRKSGVMAVVVTDGRIRAGDPVTVELPAQPHLPLAPV